MSAAFHWPHAPEHRFQGEGAYMVTGATSKRAKLFFDDVRLRMLCEELLRCLDNHHWKAQAWAVFPNHYHFVAYLSEKASSGDALSKLIKELHSRSARWLNQIDDTPNRKVWFNYWDTHLTFERSYYARLNYVHQNAVHHGLVRRAKDYCWCSAQWFEATAENSVRETIYGLKIDRVNVLDDYD